MTPIPDRRPPVERVRDLPRILHEMQQGVREAMASHKKAGDPVAVWRDGRVQWIQAEDIPDDVTTPLPEMK